MAAPIAISKESHGNQGRYVGRLDGVEGEAEITFVINGPNLISADHTTAPDSMKGTGAAIALAEHMISDAREAGFKILLVCPYLQAQFRKHSEWADVMA